MGYRASWSSAARRWWERLNVRAARQRGNSSPYGGTAGSGQSDANGNGNASGGSGTGANSDQPDIAAHSAIDPVAIVLSGQKPRKVPGTIKDIVELGFLSGLQDRRRLQARVEKNNARGMAYLMDAQVNGSVPGMPTTATAPGTSASTSTANEDDQAIYNRSPTINHNYYQEGPREQLGATPQRPNGLIPALLVVLLIAGVLGLAPLWLWWVSRPAPASPVPTPAPMPVEVPTRHGPSKVYLEVK